MSKEWKKQFLAKRREIDKKILAECERRLELEELTRQPKSKFTKAEQELRDRGLVI